jgi:hypothetical protein
MDKGLELYEDILPYNFQLIPNYDGKNGLIVIMCTHAVVDGV